ncbi:MAG TPA: ParA family protein [Steroidobacteraceae bacterium]|jgi:chromosome partitioning protein|nr:ParA family protein [Steroidobacteraceae bacterium]
MQRIVVLNPKGGSGKTTLAINLAAYFAVRGDNTLLIDRDPQGSATRWLRKRKAPQAVIHGIATFENDSRTTRSWQMRVPEGTEKIVVDSPAAVEARAMPEITRDAHKIIVPVLPSDIDIHAASRCIADLLLVAKIKRAENRIGVIANRVRKNTLMFQSLMRFLEKLEIPIVATVRDSQNYVRAAEQGVGIHEMKPYLVKEDLAQWQSLLAWLEPERVLTDQPAPLQEQPAPEVVTVATEAVIEDTSGTAAHDAQFITQSW